MRIRGNLGINLVLFGVSLLVALLGAEFLARIYLSNLDKEMRQRVENNFLTQAPLEEIFVPISPGGFANRANTVVHWWGRDIHTDSLGCGRHPAASDSGDVILFLGDSMVFGVGLPDNATIPAQLQMLLAEQVPEKPCRVVNGAVIGYDFRQYLYQLQRLAPILEPDLVLIGICQNDLYPTEDPFGDFHLTSKSGPEDSADEKPRANLSLKEAARKLRNWFYRSALGRLIGVISHRRLPQTGRIGLGSFASETERNDAISLVDDFVRTLRKLNVPSAFIVFPAYLDLGRESHLIYVRLLKECGEKVLDLGLSPRLQMDHYFAKQTFRGATPEMHFNAVGSRVVAEEIAAWLLSNEVKVQN